MSPIWAIASEAVPPAARARMAALPHVRTIMDPEKAARIAEQAEREREAAAKAAEKKAAREAEDAKWVAGAELAELWRSDRSGLFARYTEFFNSRLVACPRGHKETTVAHWRELPTRLGGGSGLDQDEEEKYRAWGIPDDTPPAMMDWKATPEGMAILPWLRDRAARIKVAKTKAAELRAVREARQKAEKRSLLKAQAEEEARQRDERRAARKAAARAIAPVNRPNDNPVGEANKSTWPGATDWSALDMLKK